MDYKKLDIRLEEILELRPSERIPKISEVAEEFGLEESVIKEEVKDVQKRQNEEIKIGKEKGKEEEKEKRAELKKLADKKKEEVKEEERRRKQDIKDQEEAQKNLAKQEVKSKMQTDFQYNIITLFATNQEDKATELIAKKIEDEHDFYSTISDVKSEMWVYGGDGVTVANGKKLIEFLCRQYMGEAYNNMRAKNVIAKINADTQIDEDEFFNKQNENIGEIPVENGILNIVTREVTPFTPKKIFFNKLNFPYDPEAKAVAIPQFFKDVLNSEDDAKVMLELIGFCLLKEYRFEKAFMFVGDGRNGKGKTINLIKRFLGSQNYSSVPLDQMNSGSSAVCEMHGKLVNLAGDISNTGLKETGIVKGLCGRDNINAKRKYLNDLSFENYAKLLFAANELPRVYDFSRGFWSRWILLDFPYTFLPQREYNESKSDKFVKLSDVSIIDKITTKGELTGLLNLALDGLERLIKNNGFSYTKGVEAVKTMWIRKSDSFTSFCIDNVEESEEGFITKKVLRLAYFKFCKLHKLKGSSDIGIKATLESLFGVSETRLDGYGGERAWTGIKFKEESDNE